MKNIEVLDFKNAMRCRKCKLPMQVIGETLNSGKIWYCSRCKIRVSTEGPDKGFECLANAVAAIFAGMVILFLLIMFGII